MAPQKTARGKAISSRNATKHGLLAKRPPLLITEDLATFEGIVQGLIDYYQPESPVEHHLIQQAAMGMLRQHRLWGAEAAQANAAIAKQQRDALLPETLKQPMDAMEWLDRFNHSTLTAEQTLDQERNVITQVLGNIIWFRESVVPKQRLKAWFRTPEAIEAGRRFLEVLETAKQKYPRLLVPSKAEIQAGVADYSVWCQIVNNISELEYWVDKEMMQLFIQQLTVLDTLLSKRMAEISTLLSKLATLTREHQQAQQQVTTIAVNPLLADYEGRINKSLYDAIDRLEAMKQSRQAEGSRGSFNENG